MPNTQNVIFACSNCDAQFPKWLGRCSGCGAWGSVKEETLRSHGTVHGNEQSGPVGDVQDFATITTESASALPTGIREFDRVLGQGIVPGSLTLLSGEPGIGKSTLIAQVAGSFISGEVLRPSASGGRTQDDKKQTVLYVSGEESGPQLKTRIARLGLPLNAFKYLGETNVETVARTIAATRPGLAIVDSVQTLTSDEYPSAAGSPAQIRAAAAILLEVAKRENIPIVLVGQVTKDGAVAGPKTLEHIVDVVLTFEGDAQGLYRLLRATKNRFGSTDEIGVFAMTGNGLQEVLNPSAALLRDRSRAPGSAVTPVLEGSRAIVVEIQALITRMLYGTPARRASGFEVNRLNVLTAVLSRRAKIDLGSVDVHVNVAGGFRITEPAADLAVVLAIASATKDVSCPGDLAAFGEVGLGGEIRRVRNPERRLTELASLGITRALVPPGTEEMSSIKIIPVATVTEAIGYLTS